MELLKSKKFKLSTLYFITNRDEIKLLPIGVPFIYGDRKNKEFIIKMLEYEILWQKAISSGYPFNFKQILKDNGFKDIINFAYHHPVYMDYKSDENFDIDETLDISEREIPSEERLDKENSAFKQYTQDSATYVDIQKLKDLNVFPVWLDIIEKAIHTNIHNFAVFNPNMYNKKLDGMYGGIDLQSPAKNLIIIDISGSIPKAVSSTLLTLCKNLTESFYADILITGTKSILYSYENLYELDITTIYEMGMNNDQSYFKALLSSEEKVYKTAIVFGDNDHPGSRWKNGDFQISDEDGKKFCKWKIDKLISFHTKGIEYLAGYSRWFNVSEEYIERINDWVKYLN